MIAVIDLETTGLDPKRHRVIEVAVLLYEEEAGALVLKKEFSSLLNPECSINPFITQLTGISSDMTRAAPKFHEVASEIVKLTEGRVIVGHNVRFDYGFLRGEFARYGFDYKRNLACTVQLSRKVVPGLASYKLVKVAASLDITLNDAHRALGDARATAGVFIELVKRSQSADLKTFLSKYKIPITQAPNFPAGKMEQLPDSTGVYYCYGAQGELLYIGKSIHMRSRMKEHFAADMVSPKEKKLKDLVVDMRWVETGSELIALLFEATEIKKHKPLYNRAQRFERPLAGLYRWQDDLGFIHLNARSAATMGDRDEQLLKSFASLSSAKNFLEALIEEHRLCPRLCNQERLAQKSNRPCFHYQIDKCLGACIGLEHPADYNARLEAAVKFRGQSLGTRLIEDRGRNTLERSFVYIENDELKAWGYVPLPLPNEKEIISRLLPAPICHESMKIIANFLNASAEETEEDIPAVAANI